MFMVCSFAAAAHAAVDVAPQQSVRSASGASSLALTVPTSMTLDHQHSITERRA